MHLKKLTERSSVFLSVTDEEVKKKERRFAGWRHLFRGDGNDWFAFVFVLKDWWCIGKRKKRIGPGTKDGREIEREKNQSEKRRLYCWCDGARHDPPITPERPKKTGKRIGSFPSAREHEKHAEKEEEEEVKR